MTESKEERAPPCLRVYLSACGWQRRYEQRLWSQGILHLPETTEIGVAVMALAINLKSGGHIHGRSGDLTHWQKYAGDVCLRSRPASCIAAAKTSVFQRNVLFVFLWCGLNRSQAYRLNCPTCALLGNHSPDSLISAMHCYKQLAIHGRSRLAELINLHPWGDRPAVSEVACLPVRRIGTRVLRFLGCHKGTKVC